MSDLSTKTVLQPSNLATRNAADFTITPDGKAFISQRRAAEILGIARSTLQNHIKSAGYNLNEINQLDEESLAKSAGFYAEKGRKEAIELLTKIGIAGARAYLYHEAGYELQAVQQPAHQFKLPQNYVEALEALVIAEKEKLALTHQVEEMQPKAQGFDLLTNAEGSMTITDASKQLDTNRKNLTSYLESDRWIYRTAPKKPYMAYQQRIDAGMMMHKTVVVERDGESFTYSQARITAKGLAFLAKSFAKARATTALVGGAA